jgi:glycosyltransferase involved in cell wall biosynthesis
MKTLTVIVPFYNEERTIARLVTELASLPKGLLSECIFVNDGSTDKSYEILISEISKTGLVHQVINKTNGGKASAIKEASKRIRSSHAVILDADLELNTFDLLPLWNVVIEEKSEIVFGYRSFHAQSAFTYRYTRGNQFLSHLYGLLFNEVITDIMCGYKLLPTKYLQECPFNFSKFAIEIELPLHLWLQRLRPYEILVDYKPRSREEGKVIGIKDAIQIITNLIFFRIRKVKGRVK